MTWQRAEDDNYLVMGGEAMHRPTLLEGVLVALILSLSVSPLVVFVQLAIGSLLAWKIAVMVMAYTYMGYLLARSGRRRGQVTLGLLALTVVAGESRVQPTVSHDPAAVRDADMGCAVFRL